MYKRMAHVVLAGSMMLLLSHCGGGEKVEVIDLNKVLDVMIETFDQVKPGSDLQANNTRREGLIRVAGQPGEGDSGEKKVDPAVREKYMKAFNVKYAENLNKAKLLSKPVGTMVNADGSITGFTDVNKNMSVDVGDSRLFMVEIDAERNRLIATDIQNGYRRDHGFSMGGLVTGMLIGHLLSRQRSAGVSGSRFANMKMSPKNYHSAAVSRARASARARSGSGSFSRGK